MLKDSEQDAMCEELRQLLKEIPSLRTEIALLTLSVTLNEACSADVSEKVWSEMLSMGLSGSELLRKYLFISVFVTEDEISDSERKVRSKMLSCPLEEMWVLVTLLKELRSGGNLSKRGVMYMCGNGSEDECKYFMSHLKPSMEVKEVEEVKDVVMGCVDEDVDESEVLSSAWWEDFWRSDLRTFKGEPYAESSLYQHKSRVKGIKWLELRDVESWMSDRALRDSASDYEVIKNEVDTIKMVLRNVPTEVATKICGIDGKSKIYDFAKITRLNTEEKKMEEDQEAPEDLQSIHVCIEKLRERTALAMKLCIEKEVKDVKVLRTAIYCGLMVVENEGFPRRNEWGSLRWSKGSEKVSNYIFGDKAMLEDYKTSTCYGKYEVKLSEDMLKLMKMLSMESDDEFVFGSDDVRTETTLKYFEMLCGLRLTSRMLRKFKISHMQQSGQLMYQSDRNKAAIKMGHTMKEQQTVYTLRLTCSHEDVDLSERFRLLAVGTEPRMIRQRAERVFFTEKEKSEILGLLDEMRSFDLKKMMRLAKERNLDIQRRDEKRLRTWCSKEVKKLKSKGCEYGALRWHPDAKVSSKEDEDVSMVDASGSQ